MPQEDNLNQELEDIFQETAGSEADQNVVTPAQGGLQEGLNKPPAAPPVMPNPVVIIPKKGGFLKKLLLILVVIIVVLFLLAGGYLIYTTYIKDNQPPRGAEKNTNQLINSPVITNQNKPPVNENKAPPVADEDGDGLSDQEEKELKTNPKSSDSDQDDLFDLEEVRVYKTNPTNPDSDQDGFLDGKEVYNGFDPNGPGKLRSLKDEIEKLKNSP